MAADGTIELHLPQDLLIGGGSVRRPRRARRAHRHRAPAGGLRSLPARQGAGRPAGRAPARRAAPRSRPSATCSPTRRSHNVEGALAGAARARGRRRRGHRRRQPDGHAPRRPPSPSPTRATVRDYAGYQPGPGPRAARSSPVPDDGGHRQRGHARRGHHRHRPRREDDDARRPPDGPRGDLRLQADAEHAAGR